ncbi:gamma-glutamylcyclotransferase family protein [Prosthecobacter sp.]|uniref:gamma-glutamylcyclotransferase family protein n=1 Tax=Prosthecobacter sp. TaxID=1965333 RepID=UPI001E16DDDB|nr:gamma-glutamylcyclotransferase family protein [Prosthecobacter sp.]MCB1274973.1 gamma-glutamylcyclotransferase [Prosthecobacter sp.]
MTRVFVYGTLKRGGENHHWLAGQRFISKACTLPRYRMFDLGGYPGLVQDDNGLAIEGEIWEVDEAGLSRLDVLEDVEGGEYERVLLDLEGGRVEGYLYLHSVEGRRDAGACW